MHRTLQRSTIRRLAWREPRATDALRARLDVVRTLHGIDLEPAGFPVAAWLLIRGLGVRVAAAETPRWGTVLRSRVGEVARLAARPVRGRLPYNVPAVVFADEAEALAAFAVTIVERHTADEWWWPMLWGELEISGWSHCWREHVELVPAATVYLEAWNGLEPIVAATRAREGRDLLARLIARFGLSHLAGAVAAVESGAQARPLAASDGKPLHRRESLAEPPSDDGPAARNEVRRAFAAPAFARAWSQVALGLARSPVTTRSAKFAAQLQREWWSAAPPVDSNAAVSRPHSVEARKKRRTARQEPPPATLPTELAPVDATPFPLAPSRMAPDAPASPDHVAGERQLPKIPAQAAAKGAVDERPPEFLQEEIFRTEFGGVFYLINIVIALELYGDFTRPLHRGLELLLWDLLSLAAAWYERNDLLDGSAPAASFAVDPLPTWFARQSGRKASQPPGFGLTAPDPWTAPEAWRSWAAAGAENGRSKLPRTPSDDVWENWCDQIMPWLDLRARDALGPSLGHFVRQRAIVIVHPAALAVHFDLATHPLALRLAGLDRDPGWIPAVGTDVRFIYA